jgi:hypothetical protein
MAGEIGIAGDRVAGSQVLNKLGTSVFDGGLNRSMQHACCLRSRWFIASTG